MPVELQSVGVSGYRLLAFKVQQGMGVYARQISR